MSYVEGVTELYQRCCQMWPTLPIQAK